MNGTPSSVLTMGLGAWGSPSLIVTLGYGIGVEVATAPIPVWRPRQRPETMRSRQRPDTARSRPR